MTIAPFPHKYAVTLVNDQLDAAPRTPIRAGVPPQFGGREDVWSPEHLLVAAALSCLKTTFDAYARREQVAIRAWRGSATGVLARGHDGPVFSAIDLDVEIVTAPGDEPRAQAVLAMAERNCIISHALSAPVHVTGNVTSSTSQMTADQRR